MKFFDVPDVYYKHLWPLLSWNDLLRMRRVCKAALQDVNKFLEQNPGKAPELEINEGTRNPEEFNRLQLKFSFSEVYINNPKSGPLFFEKWSASLELFLENFAPNITKLRLHILSRLPMSKEREFLNRLENLRKLHALNWIWVLPKFEKDFYKLKRSTDGLDLYPQVYLNLTEIDIGIKSSCKSFKHIRNIMFDSTEYTNGVCSDIESLAVPFASAEQDVSEFMGEETPEPPEVYTLGLYFEIIHAQMLVVKEMPDVRRLNNLKKISFKHFYDADQERDHISLLQIERYAPNRFVNFLQFVSQIPGFSMEMVNARWFMETAAVIPKNAGHCIKSMVNIHPAVIEYVPMENLEHLEVYSSRSCIWKMSCGIFEHEVANNLRIELGTRPEWSKLKVLKITLDSNRMDITLGRVTMEDGAVEHVEFPDISVSHLFKFLFLGVSTPSLVELALDFQQIPCDWQPTQETVRNIVTSCPNVKRLSITRWTGTNKMLTKLWQGLPKLEDVTLKCCYALGNVAFVGEDVANPVFLGLERLKHLALLDLDEMPKITDTLFRLVISRLKLTSLTISSCRPVYSVTVAGIRSLLDGVFSEHIEKFQFTEWSLMNVSTEKWMKLEKEFRSYSMI